jgi:AraC-like DNA-binding protein
MNAAYNPPFESIEALGYTWSARTSEEMHKLLSAAFPGRILESASCQRDAYDCNITAIALPQSTILSWSQSPGIKLWSNQDDDAAIFSFLTMGRVSVKDARRGDDYDIGDGDGEVIMRRSGARIEIGPDHSRLMFQVPLPVLRSQCERLTHRTGFHRLEFPRTFSSQMAPFTSLRNMVGYALDDLSGSSSGKKTQLAKALQDAIITKIIFDVPHTMSTVLDERASPGPRQFQRAHAFMRENLERAVTLDRIAQATSCSPRAIQRLFQQKVGCGPMQVLRNLRLAAAREALQNGNAVNITQLALSFQFSNPGRFAGYYKQAYGVLPATDARQQ